MSKFQEMRTLQSQSFERTAEQRREAQAITNRIKMDLEKQWETPLGHVQFYHPKTDRLDGTALVYDGENWWFCLGIALHERGPWYLFDLKYVVKGGKKFIQVGSKGPIVEFPENAGFFYSGLEKLIREKLQENLNGEDTGTIKTVDWSPT